MRLFCFENRKAPFVDVFRESAIRSGYGVVIEDFGDDLPAYRKFLDVYRHLSVNPAEFELACFRRYFALHRALPAGERAIMADSDLFVVGGVADIPGELTGFSDGLVGSIGFANGKPEKDISPHFSFWTRPLLGQFCDFLIDFYERDSDRLEAIYESRRSSNARASVSDMTLLALWIEASATPFLNSNHVYGGRLVDHNLSMTEAANRRFRSAFGRKALRWNERRPEFVDTAGGRVRPAIIHLQGRYKLAAPALQSGRSVSLSAVSAYIAAGRWARSLATG